MLDEFATLWDHRGLLSTALMSRRRGIAGAATAYMAELLRGAWRELAPETIEAGRAYGFHGLSLFRRIILPPVVLAALPMLGNQVIQIVKDSAFLTIIAVAELTHAATAIQATYFVPFASFVAAILLYWLLCLAIEAMVGVASARAEAWR